MVQGIDQVVTIDITDIVIRDVLKTHDFTILKEEKDEIKNIFGNSKLLDDFYGFFVKMKDKEYVEVLGFRNGFHLDNRLYRITLTEVIKEI